MGLELTTKFKGISSSPAARNKSLGKTDPLKRCYGALNYIARENAAGLMCWQGLKNEVGDEARTPKEARLMLRKRFRAEAGKGGRVGRRIATTGIISLPNSWGEKTVKAAMSKLANELAPEGSEASVFIVQHIDKENNAHLHFITVDGVESRHSAIIRSGENATRIRRRNVQRFNERGAPKRWRKRIADVLNETAEEHSENGVEWRSFKERGLRRKPTKHEGAERRAVRAKDKAAKEVFDFFTDGNDIEQSIDEILNLADVGIKQGSKAVDANGGEQRQRE
jgi:hypothetical protein